ncbi:hypothetical protein [Kineococcus aurantiacus]|uniref:hypothetical protein n=1 Tax=Kineococcus aurantiacus TaxID=37633 RepID=UPI0031DA5B28
MDSLFDPVAVPEQTAFLRRLKALVAPVAVDAGAVIDDPRLLEVAQAVYAAFGEAGTSGGLSKAQIAAACPGLGDEPGFEARVELFVRLGMLQPVFDKAHQQRFVFNPTSAAGLLVFERLGERGGVDELMSLLDRARSDIRAGAATWKQVAASLHSARHLLSVFADHLLRLVSSAPLSELIAERRHHAHAGLLDEVRGLTVLVTEAFPDLDARAYRVVVETQRYIGAREAFVARLLDEGGASKDFSLLDPEEYLTAARTATVGELGQVFARTVFDPPAPWLDPSTIAQAVSQVRPRPAARERPPRPVEEPAGVDPLEAALERAHKARVRRARRVDILLGSDRETELVEAMRTAGWPGAARILVEVLAAAADPALPVTASMSDELLVDPEAPVTYLTPVTLRRMAFPGPSLPSVTAGTEEALHD